MRVAIRQVASTRAFSQISAFLPSYQPESIDAYELGTKNTLLDGTLQANLTGWYYNYDSLQVSAIVANTSVNQNISAKLWGVEGEFLYQPTSESDIQFQFRPHQLQHR